jgi:hypothetical protein
MQTPALPTAISSGWHEELERLRKNRRFRAAFDDSHIDELPESERQRWLRIRDKAHARASKQRYTRLPGRTKRSWVMRVLSMTPRLATHLARSR